MRFIPSTEGPQVRDRTPVIYDPAGGAPESANVLAAGRVAEHTGHPEYVIADEIADALTHPVTTAERLLIAEIVKRHGLGNTFC